MGTPVDCFSVWEQKWMWPVRIGKNRNKRFSLRSIFTGENTVPAGSVATVTLSMNNAET